MTPLTIFLAKHRRFYGLIMLVLVCTFAQPVRNSLIWGVPVMILGMLYRVWSSGYIYKDNALAVEGPYSIVRNPLYFGSYIMGIGAMIASGVWWLILIFVLTYPIIYYCLILTEEVRLRTLFGDEYIRYCATVPRLIPHPWKYKRTQSQWSFMLTFINHKEYATGLGIIFLTGFYILRMFNYCVIFK